MWANVSRVQYKKAHHVATPTSIPLAFAPSFANFPVNKASSAAAPAIPKASKTNKIITLHSKASWSGYLEASKALNHLVVVYFTIPWYEPCRYMEPTFQEFASKYRNVEFVKINVDELYDISHQYGVRQTTTPTFILIRKAKVVDKVVGARKEDLQTKIEIHRV